MSDSLWRTFPIITVERINHIQRVVEATSSGAKPTRLDLTFNKVLETSLSVGTPCLCEGNNPKTKQQNGGAVG